MGRRGLDGVGESLIKDGICGNTISTTSQLLSVTARVRMPTSICANLGIEGSAISREKVGYEGDSVKRVVRREMRGAR